MTLRPSDDQRIATALGISVEAVRKARIGHQPLGRWHRTALAEIEGPEIADLLCPRRQRKSAGIDLAELRAVCRRCLESGDLAELRQVLDTSTGPR